MPILTVKNLNLNIAKPILVNINFSIEKGDYVGLIGPNGAGKTSLLKCLLGINQNYTGRIESSPGLKLGYVPQHYNLPELMPISVREVLQLGCAGLDEPSMKKALSRLGLKSQLLDNNFHNLSGGQKQRVIIARSLASEPDILLFDEPFSGVDYQTKIKLYELLGKLNKNLGLTILFVSHEIDHVVEKCHKVLCLNKTIHTGCHPVDFAKGKIPCEVSTNRLGTRPIHHHHNS